MYTLPKGPSKIVASARRGPPRQLDFEGYDTRDKLIKSSKNGEGSGDQPAEMSHPRPTFSQPRKPAHYGRRPLPPSHQDPTLHENHREMATLLSRQWKKIEDAAGKGGDLGYEIYREKEPNRSLENFQPFDLEKFWGTRTLTNALGKPPS